MRRLSYILSLFLVTSFVAGCSVEDQIFTTDLRHKTYPKDLDSDGDGLTDVEELARGLDPDKKDTTGNEVDDANDDPDGDGLTNEWEIKLGFDPFSADSGSTKYGEVFANNGLNDCEEDTDGDFAPNCWEILHGLDPLDPADGLADNDGDGFPNALEATEFDPNDPDSHPPKEADLVLFDDNLPVALKTNSVNVRGTARFCFGGDKLLLSTSAVKPSVTDKGFVSCDVSDYALTTKLAGTTEGLHMFYMWRLNSAQTIYPAVRAPITYDVTGTATGKIETSEIGFLDITLKHTVPTEEDYTSMIIRRHSGSACGTTTATDGTAIALGKTATSFQDTGLTPNTAYCYKIFWYDDLNNVTTATLSVTTRDPSGCILSAGHYVWYPGASVSFSIDCPYEIYSAVADGSMPSYLSLATSLPTDNAITYSGTPAASHSDQPWAVSINSAIDFNITATQILSTTPTFNTDTAITLPDVTATSVNITATLDALYDGTAVTLKALTGDAADPDTTSPASVATTETNIPGLSYTDASGCTGATSPYLCAKTSSFTAPTASTSFDVSWNYGIFDQGEYFIDTIGYLNADDAQIYGSAATTIFRTQDLGSEIYPIDEDATIGKGIFFSNSSYYLYTPAIALHDTRSTGTKRVVSWIYPGSSGTPYQFTGIAHVDSSVSTSAFADSWHPSPSSGTTHRISTADAQSTMALTASDADSWISLSGRNAGAGLDLVLSTIDDAGTLPGSVASVVNLTNLGGADSTKYYQVSLTKVFDDGGNDRIGMAFFRDSGTDDIYLSKFDTSGSFVDTTYNADGLLEGTGTLRAKIIASGLSAPAEHVKIIAATEASTEYFYVGYLLNSFGQNKLHLLRVDAGGDTDPPTPIAVETGHNIQKFDVSAANKLGRPYYSLAAGFDSEGNEILGVLYTEDGFTASNAAACKFQAYNVVSGTPDTLQMVGTAQRISQDYSGSATCVEPDECACRYPHLFYNTDANEWIATFSVNDDDGVNGAYSGNHTTRVSTFTFSSVSDATTPADPSTDAITVTTHTEPVCNLAADYSASKQTIAYIGVNGDCTGDSDDDLTFDIYRTNAK